MTHLQYMDAAKAREEAEGIVRQAGRNLQAALMSFRASLQMVLDAKKMLKVDPECICDHMSNSGLTIWERQRELYKAAEYIEYGVVSLLLDIEFRVTHNQLVSNDLPAHPENLAVEGGDDLSWCDRVCVYEKIKMDSTVWCNLPEPILELVFARLPLHRMFHTSALSKQWRSSITSARFQYAFGSTPSRRVAFVAGTPCAGMKEKKLLSFGITERRWYSLPFNFLPVQYNVPIAGDGGLLCCGRPASFPSRGNQGAAVQDTQLFVCNPLTQTWRKLPLPSYVESFTLVQLVMDRPRKQYTITVVDDSEPGSERKAARVEVFDSATNLWKAGDGIFKSSGNNVVYYKYYEAGKFHGIRAYDKNTGQTSVLGLAIPPDIHFCEAKGFFPVAEYESEIYVLQTEVDCSGIWVLQAGPKHGWEKICSVPKPEILECYLCSLYVSGDVILIVGERRDFYDKTFNILKYPELNSQAGSLYYMWMLDRSQGKWVDCMRLYYAQAFSSFSEILFEMRLDDVP